MFDRQPDMFDGKGFELSARRDNIVARAYGDLPFSVLDTRMGTWQARKRDWISLGIKSEIGRRPIESDDVSDQRYAVTYHTGGPGRIGREFDARATDNRSIKDHGWLAKNGKSTMSGRHSPVPSDGQQQESGTSIFDPYLTELLYRWFIPPGGHILDPFCGGSVRGIVAACLGYAYTGVDLRVEQLDANVDQAIQILRVDRTHWWEFPRWVLGDSAGITELMPHPDGGYDGMLTCPPYGDLERYSDDPRDLSTMTPDDFNDAYRSILGQAALLLAPDTFACVVISNIRGKDGCYRDLVGLTNRAMADAGCGLYNEAILVNSVGSLPIRIAAQFAPGRKLGKTHQNVQVYVKGDWRKAAAKCNSAAS